MLGNIDAKTFMLGFVDADFEAVVEEIELLELFGFGKMGRGEAGPVALRLLCDRHRCRYVCNRLSSFMSR